MIPICQNERLEYLDETDEIKYFFRALTGENESKFYEIASRDSKDKPIEERKAITRELVDFVLIGWEAVGNKKILPGSAFPDDGKPSKYFTAIQNNELLEIAIRVNRLTVEESKN